IGVDGTVYAINNATLFAIGDTSVSLVGTDATTQGTWKGTYGGDGYNVIGAAASYPAYATVTPAGQSTYVWAASTTDPRALQTAGAPGRIAATWTSRTTFTVAINLSDGQVHQVAAYFLDWDTSSRSERIDVLDAVTGAVLDTRSVSSF